MKRLQPSRFNLSFELIWYAKSCATCSCIFSTFPCPKFEDFEIFHWCSFQARKALNALKGLVKLQALVRGHLVRKQATATLRCMQALVTVQARARAQRIQMAQESKPNNLKQFHHRKSTQENRFWQSYQVSPQFTCDPPIMSFINIS